MNNCLLSDRLNWGLVRRRESELSITNSERWTREGFTTEEQGSGHCGPPLAIVTSYLCDFYQLLQVVSKIQWEGHKLASSILALFSLSLQPHSDWVRYSQDSHVKLSSLRQGLIRKLFLPKGRRRSSPKWRLENEFMEGRWKSLV